MPQITHTTINKNHSSIEEHGSFACNYVVGETAAGRMSGPYSCSEMEMICRGAFHSSPYLVVIRPGDAGKPDKLCLCANLLKVGWNTHGGDILSVNNHIDPDDFITCFDSALVMVDKVCDFSLTHTLFPSHPRTSLPFPMFGLGIASPTVIGIPSSPTVVGALIIPNICQRLHIIPNIRQRHLLRHIGFVSHYISVIPHLFAKILYSIILHPIPSLFFVCTSNICFTVHPRALLLARMSFSIISSPRSPPLLRLLHSNSC
jgi:hypothetical protein